MATRSLLEIRRAVGHRSGDMIVVTATSAGTETMLTDRNNLWLPDNVTRGRILLFQDGRAVSTKTRTLTVEKVGFERALYVWAHDRPGSYGLASMAFALLAGWAASAAFRRD